MDYFATKVESICGHRPEPQALVNFIHNTPSDHLSVTTIPSKVIQKTDPPRLKAQPELAQISRRNGVSIIINDKEFIATSVRDLYQQVLRYLCENGYIEMLEPFLPYATSAKRYLIATSPYHPRGNEFKIIVEYKGYFMEAHKDYRNALHSLEGLLSKCGLFISHVTYS